MINKKLMNLGRLVLQLLLPLLSVATSVPMLGLFDLFAFTVFLPRLFTLFISTIPLFRSSTQMSTILIPGLSTLFLSILLVLCLSILPIFVIPMPGSSY